MSKWKITTGALVILCIILCMMSIYMQREYNNMRISFNRADRDYAMLKTDYEKLYGAYYSYDKKILKILEGNKNVFWAKDSSAYVVKNENSFLFSFYKKPRISNGEYLWLTNSLDIDPNYKGKYKSFGEIDTLKPHQFVKGNIEDWGIALVVSSKISLKTGDYPSSKIVCGVVFGNSANNQ